MKSARPGRTAAARARRLASGVALLATVLATIRAGGRLEAQDVDAVLDAVGIEQRLDAQVPLDLEFRDAGGERLRLGDCIGDRPVILALVYYECPMLCTLVLNGLLRALEGLEFDAGSEFDVLTVSFDPGEMPELAAAKKKSYLERYGRDGAGRGWRFLTGDEPSIRRLTEAVGFRYRHDPATDEFAHSSAIIVLTPGGKVSRYFYGVVYSSRDLRLGLVEASAKRIGSLADEVLLLCMRYDPVKGKYGLVIVGVMRLAGVATVALIASGVGLMLWRERRRRKTGRGRARSKEDVA